MFFLWVCCVLYTVNPKNKIDIGQVRLSKDSKKPTSVLYARSETHLTEV